LKQLGVLFQCPVPEYIVRAAHLHDLGKVWTTLEGHEQQQYWMRLFNESLPTQLSGAVDDALWGRVLLDTISKSNDSRLISNETLRFLRSFFQLEYHSDPFWIRILDIADTTSDFIGTQQITIEQLVEALQLKKLQVLKRYGSTGRLELSKACRLDERISELIELLNYNDLKLYLSPFQAG
jgi:hypothetical protein